MKTERKKKKNTVLIVGSVVNLIYTGPLINNLIF